MISRPHWFQKVSLFTRSRLCPSSYSALCTKIADLISTDERSNTLLVMKALGNCSINMIEIHEQLPFQYAKAALVLHNP